MPRISEGEGTGDKLGPQNIPESRSNRAFPPPPPIKNPRPDKTASLDKKSGNLQGTVVFDDRITPRSGAKLLFVNADKNGEQETLNTNELGQFATALPKGNWLMYVTNANGKPEFHSKLAIQPLDDRVVTIVSR